MGDRTETLSQNLADLNLMFQGQQVDDIHEGQHLIPELTVSVYIRRTLIIQSVGLFEKLREYLFITQTLVMNFNSNFVK